MAKSEPIAKISTDFVAAIRASWNGDLAFDPSVLTAQKGSGWDQIDILEAVEDGSATNVEKDMPDETIIELTHRCLAGVTLSVTVAFNPHLPYLLVKGVRALEE